MIAMIGDLARQLPRAVLSGDPSTPITGICFDSRAVGPGTLFVALRGSYTDGHRYLADARTAGAVVAMVEPETPVEAVAGYQAVIRQEDTRAALAQVANRWHGYPSHALTLIGVTGTDGKTSTCYLIDALLCENAISRGLISTVAIRIPGRPEQRQRLRQTTPESLDVQRYLAGMRDAGARAAVLETTSHGLEMHRVDGCQFDIGVVTNVTHEHLDFHGSLENYWAAKAGLLSRVVEARAQGKRGYCVLNLDDRGTRSMAPAADGARQVWYSASGNPAATLWADQVVSRADGTTFTFHTPTGHATVDLRLAGSWNVANGLAAAGVGYALGCSPVEIARGLAALEAVPGRMEQIDFGQPFTVLVDYAHTPDGLRVVLQEARRIARNRVLTLIGSAGERDLAKRPMLGEVAQELADFTIFTSDDPRFEDPEAIIAMMAAGADQAGGKRGRDFECIEDRREAITEVLNRARWGDVVVLAGKGHERSQLYGDRHYPWDDASVARELLQTCWVVEAVQSTP